MGEMKNSHFTHSTEISYKKKHAQFSDKSVTFQGIFEIEEFSERMRRLKLGSWK